jgi:hypothetical protein
MFLKVLLGVYIYTEEGRRDYIKLVCAFESDEQYCLVAEYNFDDIYDLLCSAVELHKGKEWKVDSTETVEFLYDDAPPDLSTLGYLRLA